MLSIRTWHGKWFYDAVGKSLWCGTYNSKFCLVEKWRFLVWSLSLPLKNDIQFRFGSWWRIRTRKEQHFEAPLSTKGGTLPSWRSSSYRVPLFTLSCLFQVVLHLSKYASYTNSGASHGFVVESPLAYKSLLSIAPAPYYTHKYTSHHHTAWVTKALHWHLPVTVESLACRPAWWLNRAVELSQSSWSFQVSTFHTVTMLENLKKTCSNSTCRSLERFQL